MKNFRRQITMMMSSWCAHSVCGWTSESGHDGIRMTYIFIHFFFSIVSVCGDSHTAQTPYLIGSHSGYSCSLSMPCRQRCNQSLHTNCRVTHTRASSDSVLFRIYSGKSLFLMNFSNRSLHEAHPKFIRFVSCCCCVRLQSAKKIHSEEAVGTKRAMKVSTKVENRKIAWKKQQY